MTHKKTLSALVAGAAFAFFANFAIAQTWEELQTSVDEAQLIQAIEKPGDEPEDIHTKNVACKRLAVYGTEKAIPALVKMLANDKQNFNARFALEAMPFDAVDAALIDAMKTLDGKNLIGVIDTLGVRGTSSAVAPMIELLGKTQDVGVRRAICIAFAKIGTKDALDALAAEGQKDLSKSDAYFVQGLGDALLEAGAYSVVLDNTAFPRFEREAALYRTLLAAKDPGVASDGVLKQLTSDDASAADVALKTIREFDETKSAAVVKKLVENFDAIPDARRPLVARAFQNLKYDDAKAIAFDKLVELSASDSLDMQIAVARALANYADKLDSDAQTLGAGKFDSDALFDAKVALGLAICANKPAIFANPTASRFLDDLDEKDALVQLKIIELARVKSAGETLVKIASTRQGALRDAALAALSEIVELDDLELLVKALDGETNDQKVDWLLRAACTRLPREECAAKVAEIFGKADLEQKNKILPLLKQIGGPVALDAVANACNGPTVDKATQILGEWNTPEDAERVADVCLAIARQAQDAKYHSRGIRGYVRVARQFDLPVDKKIQMCKIAFDAAKRDDDKKLIFEVFKRNIVAENVAAALEYVKYPEHKEAACEAAVFVAEKIRVSQPDWNWNAQSGDAAKDAAAKILVDGMKKVVETTSDAALKERAQKLL